MGSIGVSCNGCGHRHICPIDELIQQYEPQTIFGSAAGAPDAAHETWFRLRSSDDPRHDRSMCGRYTHLLTWRQIVRLYLLPDSPPPNNFKPRYNIAPTERAPVVRERKVQRELVMLRWGLIPFWAGDAKIAYRTINTRAERVATAPALGKARRCLIPTSGFYEWLKTPNRFKKAPVASDSTVGPAATGTTGWIRWRRRCRAGVTSTAAGCRPGSGTGMATASGASWGRSERSR